MNIELEPKKEPEEGGKERLVWLGDESYGFYPQELEDLEGDGEEDAPDAPKSPPQLWFGQSYYNDNS